MRTLCATVMAFVISTMVHIGTANAQSNSYSIICPIFELYETEDGYMTYCNGYQTSCNDIPDAVFKSWPTEPVPCDCPDTSGCLKSPPGYGFDSSLRPIRYKIAADGLPKGLSKQVKVAKSVPAYFMHDGEPIYMCLYDFVVLDDKHLDHTCSVTIGIEMKSPISGIEGLMEIKNVHATEHPYLFNVNFGENSVNLVRAIGVSSSNPNQVPTPAIRTNSDSHNISVRAGSHNDSIPHRDKTSS